MMQQPSQILSELVRCGYGTVVEVFGILPVLHGFIPVEKRVRFEKAAPYHFVGTCSGHGLHLS
jgi:hypothetical protein